MSKITVVSYCHKAHKEWIPSWADQINKQKFKDFRILFVAHNWCESITTATATSNYNEFHDLVNGKLPHGVQFVSHNGPPVIGDVIDYAASWVKTEFMAHWDIDDVFHPDRLALQSEFLDANPNIDFLNARCIGFNGLPPDYDPLYHDTSSPLLAYLTDPKLNTNEQIKQCFDQGYNPLAHGLMVYRPEVLKQLGGFSRSDVKLDGKSPDFETWRKAINAGHQFYRMPELLMYWRLDSSSIRK